MKRRLDTIKGKRVVLTNNSNEIKYNEIGIIEKPNGKVEVKAHNNQGKIEDLTNNSSSFIYVGVKNPLSYWDEDMSALDGTMRDMALGIKYTNASYDYAFMLYLPYENNYIEKEKMLAFAIPVIPEFTFNVLDNPTSVYTFSQLRHAFVTSYGFTEQEFDQQFYEISKEEFFTPAPETIDKLTLEFDNHKLVVDFVKNTYEKDGVVSQITDGYVPNFKGLTTVSHGEIVCNNVKYETNTNNYVEYYEKFSSDVYYRGRIKVNGVGPDPNYGNVYSADGYRHSSGIEVRVIE